MPSLVESHSDITELLEQYNGDIRKLEHAIIDRARRLAYENSRIFGYRYQDRPRHAPSGAILRRIDPTDSKKGAMLVFYDPRYTEYFHFWIMSLRFAGAWTSDRRIEATKIAHLDLDDRSDLKLLWDLTETT